MQHICSAPHNGRLGQTATFTPPMADLDEGPKLVRFLTSSVFVSHKRVDNIPILYEYLTIWYKWGAYEHRKIKLLSAVHHNLL